MTFSLNVDINFVIYYVLDLNYSHFDLCHFSCFQLFSIFILTFSVIEDQSKTQYEKILSNVIQFIPFKIYNFKHPNSG